MIQVTRLPLRLTANPARRILKYLSIGNEERILPVMQYISGLNNAEVQTQYQHLIALFDGRHPDLEGRLQEHFNKVCHYGQTHGWQTDRQRLAGAYFTNEYTIESAALFNPSMVMHPVQDKSAEGKIRFILSLRATGEGHISSIAFQEGYITLEGKIELTKRPLYGETGAVTHKTDDIRDGYHVAFNETTPLGARVLFPYSPAESNGMEDARFVKFTSENAHYVCTYTAYNGRTIQPHMLETFDFKNFEITPLKGRAASDKGMAVFPEKINEKYMMVGRQGGRQLTIMASENLYEWNEFKPLQEPKRGWEMLQMGNCGSPIKTNQGWLLLTHAVGPMRRYVLSMSLLDGENPSRVLASLEKPLMEPLESEREGYVPNVLYTCGMMPLGSSLLIPYAMSDNAIGFSLVSQEEILETLTKNIR